MMPHVNRRQRQRQRRTMMMMIMMMIMVMPPGQMQPQTVAYYAGYGYESVARDGFGFFPPCPHQPTTQTSRHGTGPDWCARLFWHIFSDASLNRISFWHCTIIALLMRLTFPPLHLTQSPFTCLRLLHVQANRIDPQRQPVNNRRRRRDTTRCTLLPRFNLNFEHFPTVY